MSIARLYRLLPEQQDRFDLTGIRRLQAALGFPDHHYQIIHVAGTNGKGSVVVKTATGLHLAGNKVGLYTSPHLFKLNERIVIDGSPIEDDQLDEVLSKLFYTMDCHQIKATFFEVVTMAAFVHFADQLVDYAVVEVGLGGRLDATNIVQPNLSVITSIGLDHTDRLGSTREAIAQEKGGIIKEGVPLILGPGAQHLGLEPLASQVILVESKSRNYMEENEAIARVVMEHLELPQAAIERGVKAMPRCRFERQGNFLLDVAHNPDGLCALFDAIEHHYGQVRPPLLLACAQGKDLAGMLEIVADRAGPIHLVTCDHGRLMGLSAMQKVADSLDLPIATSSGEINEVLQAVAGEPLVVICGSAYIMQAATESIANLATCVG